MSRVVYTSDWLYHLVKRAVRVIVGVNVLKNTIDTKSSHSGSYGKIININQITVRLEDSLNKYTKYCYIYVYVIYTSRVIRFCMINCTNGSDWCLQLWKEKITICRNNWWCTMMSSDWNMCTIWITVMRTD